MTPLLCCVSAEVAAGPAGPGEPHRQRCGGGCQVCSQGGASGHHRSLDPGVGALQSTHVSGPCFDDVAHGLFAAAWLYDFGPGPCFAGKPHLFRTATTGRPADAAEAGIRGSSGGARRDSPCTRCARRRHRCRCSCSITRHHHGRKSDGKAHPPSVHPAGHLICCLEQVGGIVQGRSWVSTST